MSVTNGLEFNRVFRGFFEGLIEVLSLWIGTAFDFSEFSRWFCKISSYYNRGTLFRKYSNIFLRSYPLTFCFYFSVYGVYTEKTQKIGSLNLVRFLNATRTKESEL